MKLKFTLIAAFSTLILQFTSAPHYMDTTFEAENGDTVRFITGDGPDIRISASGEGEKKKFAVTVQVPAGAGLRKAVTLEVNGNKVRDRIAALLVAATSANHGDDTVKVILTGDDAAQPVPA